MRGLKTTYLNMAGLAGRIIILTILCIAGGDAVGQAEKNIRVVSLAPSLTELIAELGFGDMLVGRSSACDYPPEVIDLPVAGDFGRPFLEALRRLNPDLVVATAVERPQVMAYLRQAGIRTLQRPCESWEEMMETALIISKALGDIERGEQWVEQMRERRRLLEEQVEEYWTERQRPRVFVYVWGTPLTTAGRESFLNDLVTMAGGTPLGGKLPGSYVRINTEWVLREDPDVILLMNPSFLQQIERRPGWRDMTALRKDQVVSCIDPDLINRPGPRMIDGAEKLAARLVEIAMKAEEMKPKGAPRE